MAYWLGMVLVFIAAESSSSPSEVEAANSASSQPVAADPSVEPPATEQVVPQIDVLGRKRKAWLNVPGSGFVLDAETLQKSIPFSTPEALRKVPGINALDEEGLGLRPNLGIRGLDPVRSRKVLLLEDGIPLTFAPYGDNASYYHPPIERMERIEVLKGSSQLVYGPQTVGGVINYITSKPPTTPGGFLRLALGNQNYVVGQGRAGGVWGDSGAVVDYMFKQGQGSRERTFARVHDLNLKTVTTLGDRQAVTIRANYYKEDSQISYSGLRLDEYRANPRGNPFKNDRLYFNRGGLSATHQLDIAPKLRLTTNLYGTMFLRDWWRQSSNSRQRPADSADPACVDMTNLDTTCGNEGRVRKYYTAGLEPRLQWKYELFDQEHQLDTGVRVHVETQDRMQLNGPFPKSRTGAIAEHNARSITAFSGFVQNKFQLWKVSITPGIRVENITMTRQNKLANGGAAVGGTRNVTALIPGIGAAYNPIEELTIFGGVHKGFAPPRPEDSISDSTGGVIELSSEESINYELGARSQPVRGITLDVTGFALDFSNQIIPTSVAGGAGATLTNGGKTLHAGMEAWGRVDSGELLRSKHNVFAQVAYTFIPVAKFMGTRFSNTPGFAAVSTTGRRLPYSPEQTVTTTLGYAHTSLGIDVRVEMVHVGRQFADDLNTLSSTDDGQRGVLPAYTVFNAALSVDVPAIQSNVFISVKNLFDSLYIVDRTRGILPGMPLTVFGGLRFNY